MADSLIPGPYHEGECALQREAGVRAEAERLGAGISARLTTPARIHLRTTRTAILAVPDGDGACWVTALLGSPGFLDPTPRGVLIRELPAAGDPAGPRRAGNHVGMLVIDLAARRRLRINGRVQRWGPQAIEMSTEEVYGNCPRHIRRRHAEHAPKPGAGPRARYHALTGTHQEWIRRADTLFLGTHHPGAGADASHRGGPPGFVQILDDRQLAIPDYPGNNMFNTLGNIAVHPVVGLLFWDIPTGATLQITGHATIDHDPPEDAGVPRLLRVQVIDIEESRPDSDSAPLST